MCSEGLCRTCGHPAISVEAPRKPVPYYSPPPQNCALWFVGAEPGFIALIVKSHFLNGIVLLDNVDYFEDDLKNATFYYDGGVLGFDPSNRITDCGLMSWPACGKKSPADTELNIGTPGVTKPDIGQ